MGRRYTIEGSGFERDYAAINDRPEKYRRMKDVTRHGWGWQVGARWGPAVIWSWFADRKWGGPSLSLVAANAFAADCYLAMQKPITARMTYYEARSDSATGELNVRKSPSGRYSIRISNVNGKNLYVGFPAEALLDEVLAARDELLQQVWDANPIEFYR